MTKKKTARQPKRKTAAPPSPRVDLIYQALETEMGGVEIYKAALQCVQNDELREEWEKYLEQTEQHVEVVRELCITLGLDPDRTTPGREIVRTIGTALVKAMHLAIGSGNPEAAEIVAGECVTLAETKDHLNWSLIGNLAEGAAGKDKQALQKAYEQVENEEDEHLYHSAGWARELWLALLGRPAQLPPPEEEHDVHSQEEAARVKKDTKKRSKQGG